LKGSELDPQELFFAEVDMIHAKVSVIGSGPVGEVLSNGFLNYGYTVLRASREPKKLDGWKTRAGAKASTGTFQDATRFSDFIILAVKGSAAEDVVLQLGPDALSGKTIIDVTNPISDRAPVNGVLSYFTTLEESLMERLQKLAPQAHFVKAFNSVGNQWMVNPDFGGTKPTMFFCGNNETAKNQVREVLAQFGWDPEDMGAVEAARAIEPLCILWCIPGFLHNEWTHSFKMLKK
jgi:predicted dinucleotide-binding enzyme